MNKTNQQLVGKYCEAWNTLTSSLLEPILDDKVEYHSQMVLEVLKGKSAVLEYYRKMFEAISENNSPVLAENATFNNLPCTVLTQFFVDDGLSGDDLAFVKTNTTDSGFKYKQRNAVILFGFVNGKISRINLCTIPNVSQVEKVENAVLKNDRLIQLEMTSDL